MRLPNGKGGPSFGLRQAIAMVAVVAITLGTVGVLLLSRNARHISHQGLASASRLASPAPSPTYIPMPSTAQLIAPSSSVVWALVAHSALFRSTDKGATWEEHSLPLQSAYSPVLTFINDQEGWGLTMGESQCNDAGTIWHTTDGGSTWNNFALVAPKQHTDSGIAYTQCKEHIYFIDSNHGFVTAWDDNHRPTIYRTGDGGKTWSGSTLPDPPDFKTSPGGFTLRAATFKRFGSTLYVEAYGPGRQYLFRSTDGGATWLWLTKVPSIYIAMVTESRWLQLVWPGQSMESTNSGQQWHPYESDFHTDTPVGGPQILFADSQVGYAEGRGALQRTLDGGLHWERIATPGTTLPAPPPATGTCTDQPSGPSSAPSGDNFKVVVRVPDGWTASAPGATETTLLMLDAPSSYSNQPTRISLHSFIGRYRPETLEQIAADFYGSGQNPQLVGQVTGCTVGGEPAVFFKYTQGDHAGYFVLFVHYQYLYGIQLDGVGGVDPRAWQDAKKVLGSWTWTVASPPTP
jgi:photosystem II stability/assembly factor-like uncharacterized protein